MLSQSCTLVKREKTYFVHICKNCCAIRRKSTCKIVHHVGSGHARPAAYRHILFTIQSVGEEFIPPGHLSPPQASAAARGLAALRPRLKMRVGRGALTPPRFTGISLLRFIRREKILPLTRGVGDAAPYNRCRKPSAIRRGRIYAARQPAAISFSPTCTICTFS